MARLVEKIQMLTASQCFPQGFLEQLDELRRKLSEKDELLKSAETSKNQLTSVHAKLEELKHQAAEKDSVIKSTQLQLSDAKIKLADKMAVLEKTQWEAMTANQKAEQLQKELDPTQSNVSSVMSLLEGMMKNDANAHVEDCDIKPLYADHIPNFQMEEAREAYVAAVTAAKERLDEESIAAAARARQHLQFYFLDPAVLNTS